MRQQVDRAVILAAGLGTRLKWMTRDKPKALMNVAGVPAIVHVIRALAAQGVRDIAINTFHHATLLMNTLGNGSSLGVNLYFSEESELLDSGGGVRTALNVLPGEGLLAVCNADVLSDVNVVSLASVCPPDGCSIALVSNPKHHPEGDFSLQAGLVGVEGEHRHTFSGVSVWHEDVLSAYPENETFSLVLPMRDLIGQGLCHGMLHRGRWFDIGRPRDLMRANQGMR